jgi:chromate transporter
VVSSDGCARIPFGSYRSAGLPGLGVCLVIYWQLFTLFASASLLAFGGAIGILPTIADDIVRVHQWMDSNAVVRAYVLGQFMPGPNMVVATIIGYQVAGVGGAAISTLGMYCAPITLTTVVTAGFYRFRDRDYVRRVEIALRPLALGLVLAATLRFLRDEMQSNWAIGLIVSLPVVWLHWRAKLPMVVALLLIGGSWYGAFLLGLLQPVPA